VQAAEDDEASEEAVESESAKEDFIIAIESDGEDDVHVNAKAPSDEEEKSPRKRPVYKSDGDAWSFQFATNQGKENRIPMPEDIDLSIRYDYYVSRSLLPDLMQFLIELQETITEFGMEQMNARRSGSSISAVKLGQLMEVSDLRNKMSDLRKRHMEDLAAQRKLCNMIVEMKERAHSARADIQAAGVNHPNIQTLSKQVLPELDVKCTSLFRAADLIKTHIERDIKTKERVFSLAEASLRKCLSTSDKKGDHTSRSVRSLLDRTDGRAEMDVALLSLRSSMEVGVDLDALLDATEGR
jgi:hypothetical protein